jgi:hypothetical protein
MAVAPHTEADRVALLLQFLVAFGNVAGRSIRRIVESTPHYLNLFAVLVGATSKSRKGSALSWIVRFFETVDEAWADQRIQSGLSSGEGLVWTLRGEMKDDQVADKRLLVIEPEFASVLRVVKRDHNTLSAILRQAWDTGKLRIITKNDPARATGAHVSLIGHITSEELSRELDRTEIANGFANRFLFVYVRGAQSLPFGGSLADEILTPLVEAKLAVRFASNEKELKFDADAIALWENIYAELSEGMPGLIGAVLARSEAQCLRLACLYASLDLSELVKAEHLHAPLALWDYCQRSVRFIFGDRQGNVVADRILSAVRAAPNGLTRTEICALFGRNVTADSLNYALQSLSARGLIRAVRESGSGRPAERWRIDKARAGEEMARDGAGVRS